MILEHFGCRRCFATFYESKHHDCGTGYSRLVLFAILPGSSYLVGVDGHVKESSASDYRFHA